MNMKYVTLGLIVGALMLPVNSALTADATVPETPEINVFALAPHDAELEALREVIMETETGCKCSEGGWWWGSSCEMADDKCPAGSGASCYVADGNCVCTCTKPRMVIFEINRPGATEIVN